VRVTSAGRTATAATLTATLGLAAGSCEQWRAARVELLEAEKELTRRSDELARQRQQSPWVPVV